MDSSGKFCRRCGEWRLWDQFPYGPITSKDGHIGTCWPCYHGAPPGLCKCVTCGVVKPHGEYYVADKRRSGRLKRECKDCRRARSRKWTRDNPERALFRSWQTKLKAFGLTVDGYGRMLAAQGGVCAICGGGNAGRKLNVDHCHETGRIRGLLCTRCNTALGAFGDTEDSLRRVLVYLSAASAP